MTNTTAHTEPRDRAVYTADDNGTLVRSITANLTLDEAIIALDRAYRDNPTGTYRIGPA